MRETTAHRRARGCGGASSGGAIYLGQQKVGVAVPRVRDRATNTEVALQTYAALRRAPGD